MRAAIAALLMLFAAPAFADDGAYQRGVEALNAGRPRVARVEFLNAIQQRPADPRPHLMQARVYLTLEDGFAAESEVARARELGSALGESAPLMAEALLLRGRPEAALEEASRESDDGAASARARGKALQALGRSDAAAAAFGEAMRLGAGDSHLWVDLARFRLQTGERAGAIAAADRAIALAKSDPVAITLRGVLVRDQFGLKAALPWFDRALAIDAQHIPAMVERAATLGDLGRHRDMLAAARGVLALQPGHGEARYLLAVLAARARNLALAQSLLEGADRRVPGVLLLSGIVHLEAGNHERASDDLSELLARQPGNLQAARLLALVRLRKRDTAGALAALRAFGRRPSDRYAATLAAASHAAGGDMGSVSALLAGSGDQTGLFSPDIGDGGDRAAAVAAAIRASLGGGAIASGVADARAIAAASPGAPDAHVIAGDALMLAGDPARAAAAYRKAANLAFIAPIALRLVEALQASGDVDAARRALALFLDQHPRSLAGLSLLANMRLAAGDGRGAAILYRRLRARIGDHDAVAAHNLAWATWSAGDRAGGLAAARGAHAHAPAHAATADALGWMLLSSGGERFRALALLHRGRPTG